MGDTPLDRLDEQVRERYQKEHEKIEALQTRREVELAHSQYLRNNVCNRIGPSTSHSIVPIAKWSPANNIPNKKFVCPVQNCSIIFSTERLYKEHLSDDLHSPCNPLKHLLNGRMKSSVSSHICPVCGTLYKDYSTTLQHMRAIGHDIVHEPLKVACFACPQCITLFPEKSSCDLHIKGKNHCYIQYPFEDDIAALTKSKPVPVPVRTLQMYVEKCKSVRYWYSCRKCDEEKGKETTTHVHDRKTVCADMNHGEVIASLLKSHTCVQCLCLFDGIPEEDKEHCIHRCSPDIVGIYVENDCKTFEEFIRRLALVDNKANSELIYEFQDGKITSECLSKTKKQKVMPVKEEHGNYETRHEQTKVMPVIGSHGKYENKHQQTKVMPIIGDCGVNSQECDILALQSKINKVPPLMRSSNSTTSTCSMDIDIQISTSGNCDGNNNKRDVKSPMDVDDSAENGRTMSEICSKTNENLIFTSAVNNAAGSRVWDSNFISSLPSGFPFVPLWKKGKKKKKSKNKTTPDISQPSPASSNSNKEPCSWGVDSFIFAQNVPMIIDSGKNLTVPEKPCKNIGDQSQNPPSTVACKNNLLVSGVCNNGVELSGSVQKNKHIFNHKAEEHCKTEKLTEIAAIRSAGSIMISKSSEIIPTGLDGMHQIIFLDLDNWGSFFQKLPEPLPDKTFVWAFYGGNTNWSEPVRCRAFKLIKNNGWFHLHNKCSGRKDAADFAICMWIGRMDERLPKHIPFIILSGDKGFNEIEDQMHHSERRAVVINPHHCEEQILLTMIKSVADI